MIMIQTTYCTSRLPSKPIQLGSTAKCSVLNVQEILPISNHQLLIHFQVSARYYLKGRSSSVSRANTLGEVSSEQIKLKLLLISSPSSFGRKQARVLQGCNRRSVQSDQVG